MRIASYVVFLCREHALEACYHAWSPESRTGERNAATFRSSALDWLCLNVPESNLKSITINNAGTDYLPTNFKTSNRIECVAPTSSTDESALFKRNVARTLTDYGFYNNEVEKALALHFWDVDLAVYSLLLALQDRSKILVPAKGCASVADSCEQQMTEVRITIFF